ncbi:MAG: lysophospholipid acyltransferase family protein [Melioribacteraceae bacterium]|nr:lysophospholipid acyltransferase family protein [Melioribacteraceae bacterium]
MIKADHKKYARAIFDFYINRLLKKSFLKFYIDGDIPNIDPSIPLVVTPNHISWWDGFFIDFINRKYFKRKFHVLMLEEQLIKYPFFKKLGAIGFNPNSASSIIEVRNYISEILENNNSLLTIYPQGIIEPYEKKPLTIKEGIKILLHNKEFTLLPLAFKIQYLEEKNPALFIRAAEPIICTTGIQNFSNYSEAFSKNIDLLNETIFNKSLVKEIAL